MWRGVAWRVHTCRREGGARRLLQTRTTVTHSFTDLQVEIDGEEHPDTSSVSETLLGRVQHGCVAGTGLLAADPSHSCIMSGHAPRPPAPLGQLLPRRRRALLAEAHEVQPEERCDARPLQSSPSEGVSRASGAEHNTKALALARPRALSTADETQPSLVGGCSPRGGRGASPRTPRAGPAASPRRPLSSLKNVVA